METEQIVKRNRPAYQYQHESFAFWKPLRNQIRRLKEQHNNSLKKLCEEYGAPYQKVRQFMLPTDHSAATAYAVAEYFNLEIRMGVKQCQQEK